MEKPNYKITKYACFYETLAGASAFCLPPLLFATFRNMYGISYSLLGFLVLLNFCTQLFVDLIFSFFSNRFNIHKTIRIMPILTSIGFIVYAIMPSIFPQYAYIGLVIGTLIFSVAAGLSEVLLSPLVAALPSDNPERDMSALHSLYAYGFVTVVIVSTLYLEFVGSKYWAFLVMFWAILPLIGAFLLFKSPMPDMSMDNEKEKNTKSKSRTKSLVLCMGCIFLGAAAECTMSNWISVYAENALHMPKVVGDIFGMSLFALLLGFARTAYSKFGKNIYNVLFLSMLFASMCYVIVAFSTNAIVSLIFCAMLGIFTAMLWPGTLIFMEEKIPYVSVSAYALMASGGDLGASFAPQSLGIVVDNVSVSEWAQNLSVKLGFIPELIGFKVGILMAAIFPLLGVILLLYMKKYFKKILEE